MPLVRRWNVTAQPSASGGAMVGGRNPGGREESWPFQSFPGYEEFARWTGGTHVIATQSALLMSSPVGYIIDDVLWPVEHGTMGGSLNNKHLARLVCLLCFTSLLLSPRLCTHTHNRGTGLPRRDDTFTPPPLVSHPRLRPHPQPRGKRGGSGRAKGWCTQGRPRGLP